MKWQTLPHEVSCMAETTVAAHSEPPITRRALVKSATATIAAAAIPAFLDGASLGAQTAGSPRTLVYVGNFSSKPTNWETPKPTDRGFGIYTYNSANGDLELLESGVLGNISVGATCVNAQHTVLYCTHEFMTQPDYFKGGGGLIYSLAIDQRTGELNEINHQPSYGSLPSYPAIDATGRYLIVTNYTGGTPITKPVKDPPGNYRIVVEYDVAAVVLFRLDADGSITDPCDMFERTGSGPGPEQTHSRFHSVMRSPLANLFLVCDWGSDRIYMFRINAQSAKLEVCGDGPYQSIPGSKPRYSAFHPTQPYVFVNHEGKTVISAFRYDVSGHLRFLGATGVLPSRATPDPTAAQSDIRIHPSGQFVYTVIRGEKSFVSVLSVGPSTGELSLLQTYELEGGGPRGCAVSPDGRFLYVALTSIHKVVQLAIGADGKLSSTGKSFSQPNPGNITFVTT